MNTGTLRTTQVSHGSRRIAFVGGSQFDQPTLDRFLWSLREKYPDAIIRVGNGRGAEQHVKDSATALGFTVEQTRLRPEWFGKDAMMCDVGFVLGGELELYKDENGKTQHRDVSPRADIYVLVGDGSRADKAMEIIHRVNMHQRDARGSLVKKDGQFVSQRTPGTEVIWHRIAQVEAKPAKKATRKPKKAAQLAA